jgi:eukaryotic translation initiation factor 2C
VKDATGNGSYQTVAKYFKDKYNLDSSPIHPAVNVGTRDRPCYLIQEVCVVRMGQPAKAKLSGSQTTAMLNFAALRPHQNAELITQQGIDNFNLASSNPTLSRFMLALANREMITVPGRILAGPDVFYKSKKVAKTNGGSWNMRDIQVSSAHPPLYDRR